MLVNKLLKHILAGVFVLGLALAWGLLAAPGAHATTGINSELSFEGKIVNTNGTNITDGTYNMEFKIYSGGTATGGGTLVWTEDWLVGSSEGGIALSSGTFQVNLGATCPFSGGSCETYTNSGVNWNSYPLYLSIQIGNTTSCTITTTFLSNCGGDGEMSPYILLTASPYAMNAGELGGLSASQYAQLSANETFTGTNTIQVTSSDALNVESASSTNSVFSVNTSGDNVSLGQLGSSGLNGALVLNSATAGNYAVTLSVGSSQAATYSLYLPKTSPTTGLCLATDSSTASQLDFSNCEAGGLQGAYNAGSSINTAAGGTIAISAGAVPTASLVTIGNSGEGITTNGVSDLAINFTGGNAAVSAAGLQIDYVPGGTSGGTWEGLKIDDTGSGAASGVTSYGLDLVGPSSSGSGDDEGIYIGTGWDIGLDIQSGGLQLAAQSDPTSPTGTNLKIYAKSVAGLVMPEWLSPTDQNTAFQPGLGFNRIVYSEPNGTANCSTGATGFGSTSTGGGTCTAVAPASTNLLKSVRLENFSTGTTAGTVAYQKQDELQVWRGNAADLGGWFYEIRFGLNTTVTGNYVFVGMTDSTATPSSTDPTTGTTPGKLGLAIDTNSGDWDWVNNVTGTAPTVTNLGSSFPVNTTDLYELMIYCAEDGSTISYRVTDVSTGAQVTNSVTSNIPSSTTFLAPEFLISNNAQAAAAILSFNGWYLQSDN